MVPKSSRNGTNKAKDGGLPEFLNLLFRENDVIEIRPIETYEDEKGKKRSRLIHNARCWIELNKKQLKRLPDFGKIQDTENANILFWC